MNPTVASPSAPIVRARRQDLDGLRAVAVLLVAVYHVWVGRVSGGVDVFLLLSGFFVGGGIVRACLRGDFELGTFVVRTARRLLPMLVTVLAGCMLLTVAVLPPGAWTESARQTLASVFYVENWYLAVTGREYAGAAVVDSPFQHLWSMSVQGQLFVGIAVLAMAGMIGQRRRGRRLDARTTSIVLVLACGASFAWACVGVWTDPAWAYFDTLARAWEFLLGTVLALVMDQRMRAADDGSRWRGRATASALAAWAGLVAILLTGVLVDGADLFPGPATLLPLAGAALVVLLPGGHGGPARILSWYPFVVAGRYAYAFYLWHWPILVLAIRLRDRPEVGWLAGSAVLLISAVLAWVTVQLVQSLFPLDAPAIRRVGTGAASSAPAAGRARARFTAMESFLRRRRRGPRRPILRPVVVLAGVLVVALPTAWLVRVDVARSELGNLAQDLTRYPGAAAAAFPDLFHWNTDDGIIPAVALASEDKPRTVTDGCNAVEDEVVLCSYGDLGAPRVVAVAGGSHTEQWIEAIAALGEEEGFRVDSLIKWSCELADGPQDVEYFDEVCLSWAANALDTLTARAPDAVFTTWTRPSPAGAERREIVPGAYERAWARLSAAGITTVAIRDNPWTAADPVGCISDASIANELCGVARASVLDETPPLFGAPNQGSLVRPLDLTDLLCPDDWCTFAQGGRLVYRDDHHLTNSWALSTVPVLQQRMMPLLGW
ncbi:acyltransferase family protein [Microbacterium sp. lyk4-40-TSB-66]|uniref:acyltransferase family protein n=1 Tax=Microbacterium sp. lyk4-40-TSB-66 TaxID=3040294 RepID=UPI00254BE7F3|nr:acyltransferase family protein [Microbacterium sp. lyk4-40-TSB-66]